MVGHPSMKIKIGNKVFNSLKAVAKFYKKNYFTIYSRINKLGWSIADSVKVPVRR